MKILRAMHKRTSNPVTDKERKALHRNVRMVKDGGMLAPLQGVKDLQSIKNTSN